VEASAIDVKVVVVVDVVVVVIVKVGVISWLHILPL
jgi:hypothetical protein